MLKVHLVDIEMRKIQRGKVFSHWIKKINNILTPGNVENLDFSLGSLNLALFINQTSPAFRKFFSFCPGSKFPIVLDSIFHRVIDRADQATDSDTGVSLIL